MKVTAKSILFFCYFCLTSLYADAQLGIGTSSPSTSSKLDVSATDKGLLIPRVALSSLSLQTPVVGTMTESLLVYNTATINNVTPGFYYWSGTAWVRLAISTDAISSIGSISGTSTANGATITSGVLSLAPADATNGGIITTGTQTIAGSKTLSADLPVNGLKVGKGSGNHATNTALGVLALGSTNTADFNTAIGFRAMALNTSGNNNSAFGRLALENNLDGHNNSAIGTLTLRQNSSGAYNVGIGNQALNRNTTGEQNTAVGTSSLESNIDGYFNTAVGRVALYANTSGEKNTGMGFQAGGDNITGSNNSYLGFNSGLGVTSGSNNTILGANITGLAADLTSNIIIANGDGGASAIKARHDGTSWSLGTVLATSINSFTIGTGAGNQADNTVYGASVFSSNTTGNKNTVIGKGTLSSTSAGSENIVIGFNSGSKIADGTTNLTGINQSVLIGTDAKANNSGETNQIVIGYNAIGAGSNSIRLGNTSITSANVQVAWNITSDKRWKSDIQHSDLGLQFIKNLRPVRYYRTNDKGKIPEYGFIAQEMEETLLKFGKIQSGIVSKDGAGMYSIRYNDLLAPMVKAMQEQQSMIEKQNKKIEELTILVQKLLDK